MKRSPRQQRVLIIFAAFAILGSLQSCKIHSDVQTTKARLVDLISFELDPKNPERKQFGALSFMRAFQLDSKDKRFGGLSGLVFGTDGQLYAVSNRGYWLSAKTVSNADGALLDLLDWQIAPILTPAKTSVTGSMADAEALTRARVDQPARRVLQPCADFIGVGDLGGVETARVGR